MNKTACGKSTSRFCESVSLVCKFNAFDLLGSKGPWKYHPDLHLLVSYSRLLP